MKEKRRRLFAFLNDGPPQRYFVTMQFVILGGILLFLLYNSFELFKSFSVSIPTANISQVQLQFRLKDLYTLLAGRIVIIFLIGFLVNVFFGLSFLHRITGPMVRVRNILNKISDGE